MFTGIIEETGRVVHVRRSPGAIRLTVETARCGRGVKLGASLAVNGCCLTVVALDKKRGRTWLQFDLLLETWDRTNLRQLAPGKVVNLERSLAVGGRLDGHFVTGHIDGCGVVTNVEERGGDHLLEIRSPPEVARYLVYKGSVAVDGISLTVAAVRGRLMRVWIIPHTWSVTALQERRKGDLVNLEADILAKYVDKLRAKGRG